MRTKILAITLAILCATSAEAQATKGKSKAALKEHGCMMMSDSVSKVLRLDTEQLVEVKASDERCMKACAKSDANPTGEMDRAAMSVHDDEMKRILSAEQYVKWSAMCNTSKADKNSTRSKKY